VQPPTASSRRQVDPRGQRVAAGLTAAVLAAALLTLGSPAGTVLLAWQVLVFAAGALLGPATSPHAWLFRRLVRPRLGPPRHTEDAAPPRFAQAVGLGFALVALVALVAGNEPIAAVATAGALAAAFLNAAFGLCLGCELYLRVRRLSPVRRDGNPAGQSGTSTLSTPLPEV
jgi:hypothetical protein